MRNQRLFQSPSFAKEGGFARLISSGDEEASFIQGAIAMFLTYSKGRTKTPTELTAEVCAKQNIPVSNAGLVLEDVNHRALYVFSEGTFTDVDLDAFASVLFESLTDDEVYFRKGDPNDPMAFDAVLSVQFNTSHRLLLRRSLYAVDIEKCVGANRRDKEGFILDKSGERVLGSNGMPVHCVNAEGARNVKGWEVTFVPNEYKSSSSQTMTTVEPVSPTFV